MAALPPPRPTRISETGLEEGFLMELLIKNIYRLAQERATDMSDELRVAIPIVEDLIQLCREAKYLQTLGSLGASVTSELRYELTESGRAYALDALRQSEYIGPAPVPLAQYVEQVKRQRIRNETITRNRLAKVLETLTMSQPLADSVGPAANSSASMLLYGPPGNGKSSIAVAICSAFEDMVFIPHALEVDRQIITMLDSTIHTQLKVKAQQDGLRAQRGFDKRYAVCKRPIVITGGELTIDQLDLQFNPVSRIYEAPMQLKAAGGVFVIDDFGRQREQPQALINRWIIPLEAGVDYLSLQSGRKIEAPFDTLVIFSTNIPPRQLVDDAALRRIRHKIEVPAPSRDEYIQIFVNVCRARGVGVNEDILRYVLVDMYEAEGRSYAAFHPGFLMDQIESIAAYEGVKPQLNPDFLQRAWRNLFTAA
ncbi:MAG: ATPase [Pseudomonadota bacterium]